MSRRVYQRYNFEPGLEEMGVGKTNWMVGIGRESKQVDVCVCVQVKEE